MQPCRKVRPPTGPSLRRRRTPPTASAPTASPTTDLVIRLLEHPRSAAVAREEQRAGRNAADERRGERLAEVLAAERPSRMWTEGLADTNLVADRQRAAFLVRAKHGAHQKVAATVLGAVLVDDQACEDPA